MDRFYIIPNLLKDGDYAITNEIKNYIESRGGRCYTAEKDSDGHIIPGTVPDDAQCGLVLGGDGTLIRSVRDLGGRNLPLLGINLGTLGYLAEVDLDNYKEALELLFNGTPDIEERMMLCGTFAGGEDLAMNDIVLAREGKIRIINFNIYVDGSLLNSYQHRLQSVRRRPDRGAHRADDRCHTDLFPCTEYEQHRSFSGRYDRGGDRRGPLRQTGESLALL